MANRIVLNPVSYHGSGAILEIAPELKAHGCKKALVCSGKHIIKSGEINKILDPLTEAGIEYALFNDIKPNPSIENVQAGVEAFKAAQADSIIAVGGGSIMDTAKAIGIIINNPEFADVRSLEGVAPTKKHAVFTVAVPTTAGTAAEVTINYVITDVERKRKFVCVDTNDIPDETDPTVPEWAKEPYPPSYSAADVGAAPASIVPVLTSVSNDAVTAKLNAETALRIVLGESVWFAVTNNMRTVEGVIPSLQLWEVRGSATNLVYDSREEITNTVRVLTSELRAELEARIPSKAWGNYQSDGTDNPQPGEVAIINPPTIILTGGGTFNKYIEVGDSSVWVLQSSGPVSFGGNTNGNFFAVHDDEGNTHFKVAKTDSYDLPMFISDILPRQSQNHILIYTATTNRQGNAVAQPVLFAANDLKNSTWHEEVEGEIDALGITVSWAKDETIPAWVATITPDVWYEKMFFRAKVTQEGGVAVINTAPVRFDGGVQIGNGTYRLVPYTTGGKTYLTVEGMP